MSIDREEFISRLKDADSLDTEMAHIEADKIICELLISLGYEDVVTAYEEIRKWYA